MSGFSYDLQKIRAIILDVDGVLSPSLISISSDGKFLRNLNLKDLSVIQKAISEGFLVGIVSEYLGLELDSYLKVFSFDAQFVYTGVQNKKECVKQFLVTYQLAEENILFIGDDLVDREAMALGCLSVAPADASIDVLQIAKYISPYNGGEGVVRDVIEQVLKAQSKW